MCRPSPDHSGRSPRVTMSESRDRKASLAFGQAARDAGIARSMGSKGDCWDNAESFFATLNKGTGAPLLLALASGADHGGLRVHRGVLQPRPTPLDARELSPADYENGTPSNPGASLAASRLAHSPTMINT
jgi:transposase InsO family protein